MIPDWLGWFLTLVVAAAITIVRFVDPEYLRRDEGD